MPNNQNQVVNSQTLVIDVEDFDFETIDQHNGLATIVKFKVENPDVKYGDVLLILSGTDIHFHGFIGKVEDGWAVATDQSGSMLPAGIH